MKRSAMLILFALWSVSAASQPPLRFKPIYTANKITLNGYANVPIEPVAVAVSGSVWFLPTTNGLWKSTDKGKKWEQSGFVGQQCLSMFVTDSYTLILPVLRLDADRIPRMYRSTDNGRTWVNAPAPFDKPPAHNGPPPQRLVTLITQWMDTILAIAEYPSTLGPSQKNTALSYLYCSTNDGQSWDTLPPSSYLPQYRKHLVNRRGDMLTGYYDPAGDIFYEEKKMVAVFKPKDSTTWRQYPLEQLRRYDYTTKWNLSPWGVPYATSVEGLYELHNEQWRRVEAIPAKNIRCLSFGDNGSIYTVWKDGTDSFENDTTGALMISLDSGRTWRAASGAEGRHLRILTVRGDTLTGVTAKGYVIHSSDNGESWRRADSGLSGGPLWGVVCRGDSIVCAGSGYMGAWLSTDNGEKWRSLNLDDHLNAEHIAINNNGDIFITTAYQQPGLGTAEGRIESLLRTTDGGASWRSVYPSGGVRQLSIHPVTGDLFAANSMLLRSSDNGETWIPFSSDKQYVTNFCFPDDSSIVFAGDNYVSRYDSRIRISRDYGKTWTNSPATNISGSAHGYSIYSHKGRIFLVVDGASDRAEQDGLFYSDDIGYTWTKYRAYNMFQSYMNVRAADSAGRLYAYDGFLWTSDDNGTTWQEVDSAGQLPGGLDINDIAVSRSGYIFLATSGGLYRSTERFPPVGVREEPQANTMESWVFPNPATEGFTVHYPETAAIRVRDVFGRVVLTGAVGDVFSTAGLAGGVYFVELYLESRGIMRVENIILNR